MSYEKLIRVTCDRCGAQTYEHVPDIGMARAILADLGWLATDDGSLDICRTCVASAVRNGSRLVWTNV